jgi:hypothetical protein
MKIHSLTVRRMRIQEKIEGLFFYLCFDCFDIYLLLSIHISVYSSLAGESP